MGNETPECSAGHHEGCAGFLSLNQYAATWCMCVCHRTDVAQEITRRVSAASVYQQRVGVWSITSSAPASPAAAAPADGATGSTGALSAP